MSASSEGTRKSLNLCGLVFSFGIVNVFDLKKQAFKFGLKQFGVDWLLLCCKHLPSPPPPSLSQAKKSSLASVLPLTHFTFSICFEVHLMHLRNKILCLQAPCTKVEVNRAVMAIE